jgi:hypothetical protein
LNLRVRIPASGPPQLLDFQNRRSSSLRYALTQFDNRFAAIKHAAHSRPARSEYFAESRVRRVAAGHKNDLWWRSVSRNEGREISILGHHHGVRHSRGLKDIGV